MKIVTTLNTRFFFIIIKASTYLYRSFHYKKLFCVDFWRWKKEKKKAHNLRKINVYYKIGNLIACFFLLFYTKRFVSNFIQVWSKGYVNVKLPSKLLETSFHNLKKTAESFVSISKLKQK